MVTVVFSGTWMVCFPIRDILAVVCTVERLTGAVRGFARLNLAVVANMLCGSVDCCGDSGEGIHRRDDQKIERRNNVHNVRGGGMSHANAAVMRCRPDVAIAHNHALVSVPLYLSLSLSVSLCLSLSHLCHISVSSLSQNGHTGERGLGPQASRGGAFLQVEEQGVRGVRSTRPGLRRLLRRSSHIPGVQVPRRRKGAERVHDTGHRPSGSLEAGMAGVGPKDGHERGRMERASWSGHPPSGTNKRANERTSR